MTRETKIGLLVGLAFIIVIGILLSDHFRGAQEPPAAALDHTGAVVRQTVNAPGSNQPLPPVTLAPDQINPRGAVPTPRDLEQQTPPVVLKAPAPTEPGTLPLPANDPLAKAAQAGGQELVAADGGSNGAGPVAADRTYKAQAGDTVSKMAAKLLGANTARNRQAIIAANDSLRSNPNKVVVGQEYAIPAGSSNAIAGTVSVGTAGGAAYVYVVKEGDTLWGIATGQLGKASAVEAIKELNQDELHGTNTVKPGMKLRLPSQPVAIAD